ncbi:putative ubiquitin fusion degradation protein [Yarrowia sp. B02]|nr:putative ubiquitin fusion degradation protein [Yarrowia sp. B02]
MAVDTDDDNRDTEMGDSVILSRTRDTRLEDDNDDDEVLDDEHDGVDDLDDEHDSLAGVSGGASGLLRSLAGEMGGMSWHMNFQADRVRELLENVRQAEDATVMLILLQEISEVLLMSNQDILLYSFPVDSLCNEMSGIMTNPLFEDSQDCAIMACRTLYNLWEVSPTVSSNICSAGIAKTLADKLTNLTDVDFAEQAMQLLEKLSSDHPESPGHAEHLLRQGCLRAALIHLDFFATHVQRSAVTIAANCCKHLSASMFDQIQEVMPILANTLTSSDQKVVERGSQAVARTIERLGKSCDEEDVSFESIVSSELVTQLTALLVHGDSAAQRTVLQTLAIIARHSDSLAAEIVKADITGVLLRILGNSGSEKLLTALVKAPPQLIEECVKLIFALLPDAVTLEGFPDGPFRTSRASPTRAEVLKQLPNYNSFCSSTLHLLFELFAATMAVRVKRKIVYSVIRLLAAAPPDTVVALPEVAVFISSVLNQSEDDSLILGALDMSIFLIENHSAVFGPMFASEGILDQIAAIPPPPRSTNKFGALSADSDDDEEDDIVYDFSCNLKPLIALYVQRFQGLVESNSVASDNNGDLVQIAALLDGPDFKQGLEMLQSRLSTMSTFQLTHSDVVVSLLQALTVDNGQDDLVERRREFLETFCSNKENLESFAVLIDKLLEGLARTERFEVLTSGLPDSGNLETTLGKQVRLNLVAERGTDLPKQYRNMFVSIHAIATFKAVDDFFRSKVQTSLAFEQRMSSFMRRRFRGSGGAGGGTLEQALSAIAAATGMPLPSGSIVGEESESEEGEDDDEEGEGEEEGEEDEDEGEDEDDESLDFGEEEEVGGEDDEEIIEDDVGVVNGDSDIEIDEAGEAEDGEDGEERENGAEEENGGEGSSRSYADAASSSGPKWHLTFSINGQEVTHETTVFGALLKACGSPSEIWSTNFTINIKKTKGAPPVVDEPKFESEDIVPYLQSPESFSDSPRAATIMQLLSALYNVNLWSGEIAGSVFNLNPSHFLSSKLTAKFNKQLEEPLIVASLCLPAWTVDATRLYPFLFPFDVRHRYLESTSFGYSRSIQKWEEHYRERRSSNGNDSSSSSRDRNDRPPIGKLIRQKVRISRKHMFQSAIKVMELYGSSPSVLEVEYFDEVGTGLGPTLEFYATVSHQFAHKSLEMWRDDTPTSGSGGSEAFAFSQQGLFPIPLITCSNPEKVLNRFKVLGTFVARSMIDSRLIDIHFSTTFFRLACLQLSFSPTSETLVAIDEQLGKSLRQLQKMPADEIEHLGLDFTLPGFPQAELKANGSQIPVTGDNVQEYVDLIVDQTVGSGVSQQIEAFKTGFSEVFPFSAVCAFSPAELVLMCGPSVEDWSLDTLSEAVHADHGFDQRSKTFMNLLEVMSEFDETQRRQFLSFVTGSPKLPIGGFKALKPGLTVVRKASENGLGPDDYLPSVMTCVNYLKCPDFSTKKLLKSRLLQAISEGGGAFHLS